MCVRVFLVSVHLALNAHRIQLEHRPCITRTTTNLSCWLAHAGCFHVDVHVRVRAMYAAYTVCTRVRLLSPLSACACNVRRLILQHLISYRSVPSGCSEDAAKDAGKNNAGKTLADIGQDMSACTCCVCTLACPLALAMCG